MQKTAQKLYRRLQGILSAHPLISHIIPGVSLSSPAPTGSFKSTNEAAGEQLKPDLFN